MDGRASLPFRGWWARHAHGVRELVVLASGAAVYFGGRELVEGRQADALRNADWIIDAERRVGLDLEPGLQDAVLDSDVRRVLGDLSYVWLHWPLLLVVLAILYRVDGQLHRRLRDAMFASGAVALVIFAVFPVAPPRFMPGFVGTVSDDARRHFLTWIPLDWSNPYASFPSFHVGWTLIACLALAAATRRRVWTVPAMAPAVLVGFAVVSTGNHYVVDAVAGGAIALAAYWWSGRRHSSPADVELGGEVQPGEPGSGQALTS